MDSTEYGEFCEIELEQFLSKSNQIQCKVVGTISTVFKHKKYIIQVFLNKKAVIRCYKRYNQFQALYQLILMKYKNYKMKQLPSKFQLFNKQQTRKTYFQDMLNRIIKDHSSQDQHSENMHQTSRRLLSIIYLFLTSNVEEKKRKQELKKQSRNQQLKFSGYSSQNFKPTQILVQIRSQCPQKPEAIVQDKFPRQKELAKRHKLSLDLTNSQQVVFRPRSNSVQNQYQSEIKQIKSHNNQFQIKFEHEQVWRKRFLQVTDSSLLLFNNKLDNYFRTQIQLYRIKVQFLKRSMNIVDHFAQKMDFQLTRTFRQNPSILSLYHQHDYDKILIRKPLKAGEDPKYSIDTLKELQKTIFQASQKSPIYPGFDGVFNPIGKLFIFIHKIKLEWKKHTDQQTIRLRIKTGALTYESRPIVYSNQITINQGFLIPISNTFQIVKIQCYSIKDQGWVQDQKQVGKIMGVFQFNMMQFITKPQKYLISKLTIKLETKQSKAQKYSTKLQISIQNCSDFSSIYGDSFANQHDGAPLKQLQGIDDIDDLSMTVDRVLRVMGNIALFIQAFWRNVYLFKYPRLGYLFFAIILFNALFLEVNDLVRQFIAFILCVVLYQEKHINIAMSFLMNRFLFSKIHKNFKNPLILSTGEVKYLKWSQQFKYIIQDYQMKDGRLVKSTDKKRTVFQFIVHDRKFTVMQDEQSFFQKVKQAKKIIQLIHKMINSVVCAVEKVANLLSWVDYKRTAFMAMLLLILSGIASGPLVRLLVSLFCIHRFYKGLFFYRQKHYFRNRLFAVYCLRYILNKSFPNVIGNKSHHINMSLQQLDLFLSDLVFPIHDQLSQKKLKFQMDQIMGVYLQPQALYQKATKKNGLKLVHILDAVQSCQSRLKLKWIAGQQGISNQFQQLKQQTKQKPQIDVWLQDAVINFIMNTPSQLFMAFHKPKFSKRSHSITFSPTKQREINQTIFNSVLTQEASGLEWEKTQSNMDNSMYAQVSQLPEDGSFQEIKQQNHQTLKPFAKKDTGKLQKFIMLKKIIQKI